MTNIYLLEFHPSLGLALRIPRALEHLLREACHTGTPTSASALTLLERHMLRLALDVWLTPAKPKSWYSAQLQEDVGSLKGIGGSLAKRMFPPRCYYLALFLCLALFPSIWPGADHSPRACQHFYFYFFSLLVKVSSLSGCCYSYNLKGDVLGMGRIFSGLLFIFF